MARASSLMGFVEIYESINQVAVRGRRLIMAMTEELMVVILIKLVICYIINIGQWEILQVFKSQMISIFILS